MNTYNRKHYLKYKDKPWYKAKQKRFDNSPKGIVGRSIRKRMKKYGLSKQEAGRLVTAIEHCDICGKEIRSKEIHVDHNHINGKVRGYLCSACNKGLGLFNDSFDTIQSALD